MAAITQFSTRFRIVILAVLPSLAKGLRCGVRIVLDGQSDCEIAFRSAIQKEAPHLLGGCHEILFPPGSQMVGD